LDSSAITGPKGPLEFAVYYGRVSEDLRWSYMSPSALALVCARENTVQLKRLKRLANIAATEEMENMLT
jgi:hypothetical protein